MVSILITTISNMLPF